LWPYRANDILAAINLRLQLRRQTLDGAGVPRKGSNYRAIVVLGFRRRNSASCACLLARGGAITYGRSG
jgi:hypothetical protein